jgi:hypothetical protein
MSNLEFIPPQPLNTAVLFLVFNRIETTKKVFSAIRQAKPPRIYIAADGPRKDKKGEFEKVIMVRNFITQNIDWKCEVHTLFREKNLGCKVAVSNAIDWFFKNESHGIILEDDCFPSQSFFWFCEELLHRYQNDQRIAQICGSNFQNGIKRGNADYYFSIYNHIWGWASWSNRWKNYDVNLERFENSDFIDSIFNKKRVIKHWKNIYENMKQQKIDTWDYQWMFTVWKKMQLSILPNINLVENIGFGPEATHTKHNDKMANIKNSEIVLEKHPTEVEQNREADEFTSKNIYHRSLFIRITNRIQKIIGWK